MRVSESTWRNRPVFVTGATGFLGGWLVKALADRGATVVALVRDQVPRSMFMREGLWQRSAVVQGTVEDFPTLRRALGEYEVKTVFHLAAQSIVPTAKNDPAGTLEVNVRGTWNVLEACRQAGVEQVVVASSDKAYGAHDRLPYLETHALQGRFPYDASKSCADLITRMYADAYHL